jgi:two-component system, NtrC family, sensor histidine kinase PilS
MAPNKPTKTTCEGGARLRRRLSWLIVARLGAVLMLLGAGVAIDRVIPVSQLTARVGLVAAVTFALTLGYALLLRLSESCRAQAYLQMLGDIALVTGLVYLTGTDVSPLTALYLVVIFMMSCLVSRRGTFILTGLACACYLLLVYFAYRRDPLVLDGHHALQSAIGFYIFAFFAVAFLGSQFNERLSRTDETLALAHRNLSDLRAFSERVIDSISSGLVTTDLDYRIISFNRAAHEITGYDERQVVSSHLSRLFPDIAGQLDALPAALRSGHGLSRLQVECRTADGRQTQLGLSISPLTTVEGEITGYVLPFQDLTDVMRLEREVRRHDRLAALGRAAAAIAHEIRNPLASMRGAVQVLGSEAGLTEDEAQLMNIVLRESDRIDRIISDFLMYARPRQPELERVDLNEILEETLTLLRYNSEIDSERLQLVGQACEAPAFVSADPGQLRQVFWNLARNAIKAMPEGGTLTIAIRRAADGAGIEVAIGDTGIGMTEEQIERVFEPFSSYSAGGTGLGMSIVYHIVNEHRGKIEIQSKVGVGTTVTIRLAAAAEAQTASLVQQARA